MSKNNCESTATTGYIDYGDRLPLEAARFVKKEMPKIAEEYGVVVAVLPQTVANCFLTDIELIDYELLE